MTTVLRTKWFMPTFAVALGVLFLLAFWVGGDVGSGVWSLAVMSVFAVAILALGRFDLVRGLRGDGRDEYWERLDIHATALAGLVVITAIIVMCAWEWGHGRDGSPYSQLGALGGLAYIASVGVLRWRS
jgi:hypothetical protein